MSTSDLQLKRELSQAGAKASEVDSLASIAGSLRLLKSRPKLKVWHILKPAVLATSSLALGALIVMLSQSVTPASWLYPVQKLSDAAAIEVHPGYRATVMMRRAQQVNQLVAGRASSGVILSTLDSYETEAKDYKSTPRSDYAAFDYCKANLRQAADSAPPDVRQAISDSLQELNNT